jgi:hypothetical protein
MKIPSELKIGGHTIKVILDEHMPEDLDAEYISHKQIIRLDAFNPQSLLESSLIHEIMHVLNGTFDNDTLGHSLLDSLAEQLYQVLSDNDLLK